MAIQERMVSYQEGQTQCQGFLACDDSRAGAKKPAVLISHAWMGRAPRFEQLARELAKLGYVGFALDMYGNGKVGQSMEENLALMKPLQEDRALLARRINAAVTAVRAQPEVDATRVAAIGYCFGGLCALDLARSGADVRGVVSFHGLLKPSGLPPAPIKAKVLVLHGYDDPMAKPEDVVAFGTEMVAAKADWQLHAYGNTVHSYTDPEANRPEAGSAYNPDSDRRSWQSMRNFLEEIFV